MKEKINFEIIDKKLNKYKDVKLNQTLLKQLREDLVLKWTYNSNAIEGSTFSLAETKVLLEDGITVGGKSMKEHLEVIGHSEAIYYVEDLVKNNTKLSEREIKNIHSLVTKGIENINSGQYRTVPVYISGAEHIPPQPYMVRPEMEKLMSWYEKNNELHPIEKASILHGEFVKTHPFVDGNGRTARLLLNLELMKNGYPPIIITKEDRTKYYSTLEKGSLNGDWSEFTKFVKEKCEQRIEFINSFKEQEINPQNKNLQNKEEKQQLLLSISKNGMLLKSLSDKFKDDKEVVLQAVKNNAFALEFASDRLKNDKEVVTTAVKKNPLVLVYSNLKMDKEFVKELSREHSKVLMYADKEVKKEIEAEEKDIDSDLDGLTDKEEILLGTNVYVRDTDGDGKTDKEEKIKGKDPKISEKDDKERSLF